MKNSKEYSKKIISLYQSLKRKYGTIVSSLGSNESKDDVLADEPQTVVDYIIYGIISEKLDEKDAQAAMKRFSKYFVDWNDLRVSRQEEIAEQLGADTPENRQIALTITKVLQRVFNENHQISLESLQKSGKRQARQKLEKMEELSRFVIDHCMLTSLSSHAIPLTEKMIEYLKINDLVDKNADAATIEGFLSKQISAKNGYEFYELLRHESEIRDSNQPLADKTTSYESKTKRTAKKKIKTKKKPAASGRKHSGSVQSKATKRVKTKKKKKK